MKNALVAGGGVAWAVLALLSIPNSVFACGSCYGAADSSATAGMNFAILSMIGVTGGVMAAMTSFFFYLRRRALRYMSADSGNATNDDGGNH